MLARAKVTGVSLVEGEPMAGSVNKVILVGNLGRDPEVRYTQGNQKIVHLRIATSERWRDRQSGENRERTEWHSVVIFNENLADVAEKYLRKGAQGLSRGPAADPQMDRPAGPGALHHRGGPATLPRRAGAARRRGGDDAGAIGGPPDDDEAPARRRHGQRRWHGRRPWRTAVT